MYALYFRAHDKEADAEEWARRVTEADEGKPLDRKRDEFVALCRSFGSSEVEAEAEWQKWLKGQGG